jgi:hypothetical protein
MPYKPILRVPVEGIFFASLKLWDAERRVSGYQVCWCNRAQDDQHHWWLPPEVAVQPSFHVGCEIRGEHSYRACDMIGVTPMPPAIKMLCRVREREAGPGRLRFDRVPALKR